MAGRPLRTALLFIVAALCTACGGEETTKSPRPEPAQPEPFLRRRDHEVEYAGPGREDPGGPAPSVISIAWFAPIDEKDVLTGGLWRAALLARNQANTAGDGGTPFRLAPIGSGRPWGSDVAELAKQVYAGPLVAITGAPDGPSAHLVEQVVAKARLPFVSPVSTDPSTHLVNVPWIFSLAPGDHIWAPALAKDMAPFLASWALAVVASTHHDARVAETAMKTALAAHGLAPSRRITFRPGQADLTAQMRAVQESGAPAVLVLADAADSARVVMALRKAKLAAVIYGGPAMGRRAFREAAGADAEGVRFPLLWAGADSGPKAAAFVQRFRERYDREPDFAEAFTYDAVLLLVEAVRRAGTNRVAVRDALKGLSPWEGAGGSVTWDKTGQNTRSVEIGTIRAGAVVRAASR